MRAACRLAPLAMQMIEARVSFRENDLVCTTAAMEALNPCLRAAKAGDMRDDRIARFHRTLQVIESPLGRALEIPGIRDL